MGRKSEMKTKTPPNIILITGLNNSFVARLVEKMRAIPNVTFGNVIFWKPQEGLWNRFQRSVAKDGWIYIPYRFAWLISDFFETKIKRWFETLFLFPKHEDNLFPTCSRLGIQVHQPGDINLSQGVDLIRSTDCDLIVVCGAGTLKKTILDLPELGAIDFHQGHVENHRQTPIGIGGSGNKMPQVGAAIHFINEDNTPGNIVLHQQLPVFEYDDLASVQGKLEELSLLLYPEAIRLILSGQNVATSQTENKGKLYVAPPLAQRLRFYWNLKKRQLQPLGVARNITKRIISILGLMAIGSRDFIIRKIARKNTLSVLYYHRVTNICQDGMTVSLKEFEWQIRFLKKRYSLLSTADLEDWFQGNGKIGGKKGILITFDDGYEDNYINALPILKKYSCPAIFFVTTGLIDNNKQFEHDRQLQPLLTFKKMTWTQLQDAIANNIEIGIHSDTHANLAKIPIEHSIKEIETSIETYKRFLGKKPRLMAFPFGGKDDITPQLIEYIKNDKQIHALFSAYGNKNVSPINRWNIKRINIGSKNVGLTFWLKVEGGLETLLKPHEM